MTLQYQTIVDISLELDPKNYSMRTPTGFKKDMQFEMEVLKEHDAPGGAGQIVRGVHMRLHVSAGLGTSPWTPVRFACPPEASLLTLVARPVQVEVTRVTPASAVVDVG